MSMKKTVLAIVVVALLGGGGFWAWKQGVGAKPEQKYKLQAVDKGELAQSVAANGTLNPVSLVSVGTQVSGTVKKLNVDFNDKVKEGQVLLELDDALLSAQVRQSTATMQSAQASLDLATANEARLRELLAQDYVSKQEYDQAVQARRAAAASLAQARAQNDRDRANLAYSVIRSPVSGVVVDRVVDLGQTVAASFQTPTLIKIARDLSQMQIDSAFAEADIGNIRVGQAVRFNVDAFPDRNFKGEVRQIRLNPTTNQNVVTYNVVVAVDNPEQVLLPGMTAYVNIVVARRQDALLVPNAALRYRPSEAAAGADKRPAGTPGGGRADGGGQRAEGMQGMAGMQGMRGEGGRAAGDGKARKRDGSAGNVYVLADGQPKRVAVQLGITDSRFTEVVGGELKAGDQVITGETQANGDTPAAGSGPRMRMF